MIFNPDIYPTLVRLRKKKGLSQTEMAEALRISQNAYSRLERGETRLTMERLKDIAKTLEVDVEELYSLSSSEQLNDLKELADEYEKENTYLKNEIADKNKIIKNLEEAIEDKNKIIALLEKQYLEDEIEMKRLEILEIFSKKHEIPPSDLSIIEAASIGASLLKEDFLKLFKKKK